MEAQEFAEKVAAEKGHTNLLFELFQRVVALEKKAVSSIEKGVEVAAEAVVDVVMHDKFGA